MRKAEEVETLSQAISFYIEDCRAKDLTVQTLTTKSRSLKRFESWCLSQGITTTNSINLDVLEAYRQYLHDYRKVLDGKPLSINSKYKFLTDLKLFLRLLHKRKIITSGEFESFDLPRSQKVIPRDILSHRDVEEVISYAASIEGGMALRNRCVIELFYASAVRRTELAELKVQDIDLERCILSVYRGRGLKQRRVPIAKRTAELVQRYLQEVRPKTLSLDSENYLFLREDGSPFGADAIGQMTGKMIRRSGVNKPGSCHQFRHSAATEMLNAGADIRFIQAFLGHADISSTQLYTHVAIGKLTEVYRSTHPSFQSQKP